MRSSNTIRARRGTRTVLVTAAMAALVALTAAGCSREPAGVLVMPGSFSVPMCGFVDGGGNSPSGETGCVPARSMTVCLNEASAVHITQSEGGGAEISLDWNGSVYGPVPAPGGGYYPAHEITTPVLQPGCGVLSLRLLFHLTPLITVTAELI